MAGVEGAQIAARDASCGHLGEQRLRKGGTRDQRADNGGSVGGIELAVAFGELESDLRIVEQGQAACGDGVQFACFEKLLANRAQVRRTRFDERLERGFTRGDVCFAIERDLLHVIERTTVAEEDAEVADEICSPGFSRNRTG